MKAKSLSSNLGPPAGAVHGLAPECARPRAQQGPCGKQAGKSSPPLSACTLRAFSLVEILVTVGLLSFIVLGLLAMFNQTQRVFRSSMTQTDVLEAGRALTDLLTREIEQMAPAGVAAVFPGGVQFPVTNFFVDVDPFFPNPALQSLPGSGLERTNLIQRFFFLSRANQDWLGTGFMVVPDYPNAAVGALYRVAFTNTPRIAPLRLSQQFLNAPITNYSRIADGVVHLRVRPYALNGYPIVNLNSSTNAFYRTNAVLSTYGRVLGAAIAPNSFYPDNIAGCYFWSNSVPAYVEVELGLLEDGTLARLKAIPDANAQRQYLHDHAAQVHLFRQRIPIRNVDPSVYK